MKIFIGFAVGMLAMFVISNSAVGRANDYAARIKEQYRDCAMVGQFPTLADMANKEEGN